MMHKSVKFSLPIVLIIILLIPSSSNSSNESNKYKIEITFDQLEILEDTEIGKEEYYFSMNYNSSYARLPDRSSSETHFSIEDNSPVNMSDFMQPIIGDGLDENFNILVFAYEEDDANDQSQDQILGSIFILHSQLSQEYQILEYTFSFGGTDYFTLQLKIRLTSSDADGFGGFVVNEPPADNEENDPDRRGPVIIFSLSILTMAVLFFSQNRTKSGSSIPRFR